MRIEAIRIGENPPADVNVIVEVPVGGQPIKYEMDKDAGTLVVDRFLHTPMTYPGNYGFVPHTRSEDGDRSTCLSATRGRWSPAASSTFADRCADDGGRFGNGRKDHRRSLASSDQALRRR